MGVSTGAAKAGTWKIKTGLRVDSALQGLCPRVSRGQSIRLGGSTAPPPSLLPTPHPSLQVRPLWTPTGPRKVRPAPGQSQRLESPPPRSGSGTSPASEVSPTARSRGGAGWSQKPAGPPAWVCGLCTPCHSWPVSPLPQECAPSSLHVAHGDSPQFCLRKANCRLIPPFPLPPPPPPARVSGFQHSLSRSTIHGAQQVETSPPCHLEYDPFGFFKGAPKERWVQADASRAGMVSE